MYDGKSVIPTEIVIRFHDCSTNILLIYFYITITFMQNFPELSCRWRWRLLLSVEHLFYTNMYTILVLIKAVSILISDMNSHLEMLLKNALKLSL